MVKTKALRRKRLISKRGKHIFKQLNVYLVHETGFIRELKHIRPDWFRKLLGFTEAREWARKSPYKSKRQWYASRKDFPAHIPRFPRQVFEKEWKGWTDFLGTLSFISFEEAKEWARENNIKTNVQWRQLAKADKIPSNIALPEDVEHSQKFNWKGWETFSRLPRQPDIVYRKEWKGWNDFLGTRKGSRSKPFKEVRQWARESNIVLYAQWRKAYRDGKLPVGFPCSPRETYVKKGWKNWADFLGTRSRRVCSFKKAKEYAKKSGIKKVVLWKEAFKNKELPEGCPSAPDEAYRDKGWKGWANFLGKTG